MNHPSTAGDFFTVIMYCFLISYSAGIQFWLWAIPAKRFFFSKLYYLLTISYFAMLLVLF